MKNVSFKFIFTQLMLVLVLTLTVYYASNIPLTIKAGKASVTYDTDGEVVMRTENNHYAYAQLNYPVVWLVAMFSLWLMPKTWAPEPAFQLALAIDTIVICAIVIVIAVATLVCRVRELKEARTDLSKAELAAMQARLPFNKWSILYLMLFIVGYAGQLGEYSLAIAVVVFFAIEIIRSIVYALVAKHAERKERKMLMAGQFQQVNQQPVQAQQAQQVQQAQTQTQQPARPRRPQGNRPPQGHLR